MFDSGGAHLVSKMICFVHRSNNPKNCSVQRAFFLPSRVTIKSDALFEFSQVAQVMQLFRERLSQKVHATIPKGIVGGFE